MKLFATSDIHGDQVIMEKLRGYLSKNAYDKVIFCGDLLSAPESYSFDEYVQKQAEEYMLFREYIKTLDGEVYTYSATMTGLMEILTMKTIFPDNETFYTF